MERLQDTRIIIGTVLIVVRDDEQGWIHGKQRRDAVTGTVTTRISTLDLDFDAMVSVSDSLCWASLTLLCFF